MGITFLKLCGSLYTAVLFRTTKKEAGMARNPNARGRPGYKKTNPKKVARGIMEAVKTEGPYNDWVGMPQYYIHHITVDSEEYRYLSPDKELGIELGKKVTFRYKETSKDNLIDKNSLGVVIDPSELQ